MHLYCMRHGEACSADVDPQQALTVQGQKDVAAVGLFLRSKSFHIDHILHSPKLRARQTAELIAKIVPASQITETNQLLGHDSALEPLIEMIRSLGEDTLLVSHLPFIGHLVQTLLVGKVQHHSMINYQPGTLVCLKLCHEHHWLLDWVVHPRLVE